MPSVLTGQSFPNGNKAKRDGIVGSSFNRRARNFHICAMPLARLEQHLASKYAASRVFTPETIKKAKVATGVTLAYVVHTSDGDTTDADTEVRVVLVTGYCNRQEEWAPTVDAMLTQWSVDWTGKRLKVLTLDNRGVGNSDAPWGAYSTAMLADDTLALADHLGWSAFHLVGARYELYPFSQQHSSLTQLLCWFCSSALVWAA